MDAKARAPTAHAWINLPLCLSGMDVHRDSVDIAIGARSLTACAAATRICEASKVKTMRRCTHKQGGVTTRVSTIISDHWGLNHMQRKFVRNALLFGLALVMAYAGLKTWRRIEPAMLEQRLAAAARPGDISMLSSNTCSACVVARQRLDRLKVPYGECFVELDADCAAHFKALKALATSTFVVRGERQTGLDLKRMVAALEATR